MAGGFILLHIVPFDGKLFDDPEQAIFSLVVLNMVVFILLILALISVKEGRKKAAREFNAQRKVLKQSPSDQFVSIAENSSTTLPPTAATAAPTNIFTRTSRPLASAGLDDSKNYTRPFKKGRV